MDKKDYMDDCINLGSQFLEGLQKYAFISNKQLFNGHMLISSLYQKKKKKGSEISLNNVENIPNDWEKHQFSQIY